jgi:hypothetical protein
MIPEWSPLSCRAGVAVQEAVNGVGVVGHEDDGEMAMLALQVVDQAERGRLRARAHHLSRSLQNRTHLGIAIGRRTASP